jgi:hypothetical protein
MARINLMSQAVLRLIVTPHRDMEDQIDAIACYVGLGDQFDDDRRLVRASAAASRPAIGPASDGISARMISADSRPPPGRKVTD